MRITQIVFPGDHRESFKIKGMKAIDFVENLNLSMEQEKDEIFKDKFRGLVRQDYFKIERKGLFREEISAIGKWTQENDDLIVTVEYRQDKFKKWFPNVVLLSGIIFIVIEGIKRALDLRYLLSILIFILVLFGVKSISRHVEIEKLRERVRVVFDK